MRILVVVDVQNDFIDGALPSFKAKEVLPNIVEYIKKHEGPIIYTMDSHDEGYLASREGLNLPIIHCQEGTEGFMLPSALADILLVKKARPIIKKAFGSRNLVHLLETLLLDEDLKEEPAEDLDEGLIKNENAGILADDDVFSKRQKGKFASIDFVGFCTDICLLTQILTCKTFFPDTELRLIVPCSAGSSEEREKAALLLLEACQISLVRSIT